MKGHRELSLCGVRERDAVPVPLVSGDGSPHGAALQLQALPGVKPLRLRLDRQLQAAVQGVVGLSWRGGGRFGFISMIRPIRGNSKTNSFVRGQEMRPIC